MHAAVNDLNNARQILSDLYEQLSPTSASFLAVPTAEQTGTIVLAAARRLAKAVDKLTAAAPAPEPRACQNCKVPLIGDVTLRCVFCGQLERGDEILVAGAKRLEITELGQGALELEAEAERDCAEESGALMLCANPFVPAPTFIQHALDTMRDRYHAACEAPSSLEGSEP